MSLINDALRRKNQEKRETTPEKSDGTPMQAVHPPHQPVSLLKPVLIVVIVLLLVVAALLFWQGWQTKIELAKVAKSQTPLQSSPLGPEENAKMIPLAVATPVPTNATPVAAPEPTNTATVSADSVTNTAAVPVVVVPVVLKLQGIFYRSSNPTAMINGKTVAVDEIVLDARVLKIEREQVTVERDGKIETLTIN